MARKVTAETRFGQLMICLRESKLNYMVRETPYSAEVTIRKKFLKNVTEEAFENENVENIEYRLRTFVNENSLLNKNVIKLEKECGILKYELEELEVKFKASEEGKSVLEDQIEDAYSESRDLRKNSETSEKLKQDLIQLKNEKESQRKQFENYKRVEGKKHQEKCDIIDILENTLDNRASENERLKEELEKAYERIKIEEIDDEDSDSNVASTSAKIAMGCKECDEKFDNENDLKSHIRIYHVFECDHCKVVETTQEELEHHVIEKHYFYCEHCDYNSNNDVHFDNHMEEKHGNSKRPYTCDTCALKFRTEAKVVKHICKVELRNPTFDTFYTKSWYNANGCNALYCNVKKRDVAWLHCDKCWDEDVSCFWPGSVAKKSVKHYTLAKTIKNGEVLWKRIYKDLHTFSNKTNDK